MCATKSICTLTAVFIMVANSASAVAGPAKVALTEEPEPDSKAWQDPARISLSIDPDGEDQFSAHLNLDAGFDLTPSGETRDLPRSRSIGGYVRWDRESSGDDRQNNFEAGVLFKLGYDIARTLTLTDEQIARLTVEQRADLADRRARKIDFSLRLASGYARTAIYPDLSAPECTATPTPQQCDVQHKESLRTSASVAIFNPQLEARLGRGLRYSIQPKLGMDHDVIIDSPVDGATGLRTKGGYLSGAVGLAAIVTPTFINPSWELKGAFDLRQKISASASRRLGIEDTAERFEASATYYFLRPKLQEKDGWRAGVGIVYSHGGDPLTGETDDDRIVIALRVGRY